MTRQKPLKEGKIQEVDDVNDENELIQNDRFESQNKNNNALRSEI